MQQNEVFVSVGASVALSVSVSKLIEQVELINFETV